MFWWIFFHGINPNFPQLSLRFSTLETHWQPSSRRDRALFMFSCRNAVLWTPHVLCTLHAYCLQVLDLQISYLKKKHPMPTGTNTHVTYQSCYVSSTYRWTSTAPARRSLKVANCFTELTGWVMLPVLDPKGHINRGDCFQSLSTRWIHLCQYHAPAKQWAHGGEYTVHIHMPHMQYWYLRRSYSVFGCILQQFSLYDATGFKNHICPARPSPKGN